MFLVVSVMKGLMQDALDSQYDERTHKHHIRWNVDYSGYFYRLGVKIKKTRKVNCFLTDSTTIEIIMIPTLLARLSLSLEGTNEEVSMIMTGYDSPTPTPAVGYVFTPGESSA